jgi:TCP-1/cpn60 chaperonin family
MFRKTVTHKRMAKEISNPKLLLVAGGIEFTRSENRIASLETLFEQEDAYTEILIAKMIKIKPDIIMAGKAVSRKAQELLLKAGVVLIQQIKANLLARIARQTGATILNNHVNQFGPNVLGHCSRFRLVTFRDNEIWNETLPRQLLADPKLPNHKRQEALAAKKLGEDVVDGAEAIKRGLAKRGVAHTYVLLEGCPKHLGCTVVLRGADQATLKQVKTVFRFLAGAAYSMLLETTFFRERGVSLDPDSTILPQHVCSTSLAVDYGKPQGDRKVRPWNGGLEQTQKSDSSELSAFDHQAILITSVWMTDRTQCCPAEVKGICYYSMQDVALGQFLRDSCFNLSLKCQNPNCKKSVLDHSLSFVHNDGLLNIMVRIGAWRFGCDLNNRIHVRSKKWIIRSRKTTPKTIETSSHYDRTTMLLINR